MSCVGRKQKHHFVKWVQMLELHINGGIPFIVVNVVIDIVRDVVDDYVMIVFVVNIVVYKHVISINEMGRGSK